MGYGAEIMCQNARLSERVTATSVLSKTGKQFCRTEAPQTPGGIAILPVLWAKKTVPCKQAG